MKTKYKKNFGNYGENLSVKYLKTNGYKILDTKWSKNKREIDIVAEKDNVIHFIEVKTRKKIKKDEINEMINEKKIKNITLAIEDYLNEKNLQQYQISLDVIIVIFANKKEYTITHYKNAYYPYNFDL